MNFLRYLKVVLVRLNQFYKLREVGYQGFLIGENFMKSNDPMEGGI